jgi:hypothetical protein
MMGTIRVYLDGKPVFVWEGDESAINQILEDFRSQPAMLA